MSSEWARTLAPSPIASLALAAIVGITYISVAGALAAYAFGPAAGVAVVTALLGILLAAWRWSR